MPSSKYETRAVATLGDDRIERLFVKESGHEEIRVSWWPNAGFVRTPLVITEDELLALMREAVRGGVFKADFVRKLHALLAESDKSGV